jgi:hypothetical protein
MLSLLSTLGGLLISGLPKLLEFFQDKADKKHELALASAQTERELALAAQGLAAQVKVEEIRTDHYHVVHNDCVLETRAMDTNSVGLIAPREGDVAADLVRRLAEREMLIVVDNCEHVVAVVADLVQRIVEQCPLVRVVATSREPLMVRTEQVVPVGPLPEFDAIELFVARARSELPGVEFDEQQKAAIASLCQRLDGLPLAIELAAARMVSMTPVDVLARLNDRFRLLSALQ